MNEAIGQVEQEIENLHAIISDLRPASLDELGLRPALEALLERRRDHGGPAITAELELPGKADADERLPAEIESTVYRLVQEGLTNVVRHARAERVRVAVSASETAVSIEIQDDGIGFSGCTWSAGRSRSTPATGARCCGPSCRCAPTRPSG